MNKIIYSAIIIAILSQTAFSQNQIAKIDTSVFSKIKKEAQNNSAVIEILTTLCDEYGPRLMWSPEYKKAGDWVSSKLQGYGLQNVILEDVGKTGKTWTLKNFHATVVEPYCTPLIAYPKAWSLGTNGTIKSDVVHLIIKEEKDFEKYKGQLKGKIVLISDQQMLWPYTDPMVERYADSTLLKFANATIPTSEEKEKEKAEKEKVDKYYEEYFKLMAKKIDFCKKEGAALTIDAGSKYYGSVQVWGATSSVETKDMVEFLIKQSCDPTLPETLPQITVSTEQYNGIIRALRKGKNVKMEVNIDVKIEEPSKGFSIIAEIPGTDLKDEIVIIGAHFDTYHSGKGAADNTASVADCIEAMRILKNLNLNYRRTIRIGLWGGEEQGYVGSKAYIEKHFTKNSKEKCYAYFNMDNGVGLFRGINAQENEGAKKLFAEWLKLINDPKFQTVSIASAESTDHVAFDEAGLPGFQFIQDPLDYMKTYHTNVDLVERIPREDLKQNAINLAIFAYIASMQSGGFPQKK